MSDLPPQKEMFSSYISRYCDQSLPPDELAAFEGWLATDQECMAQFLLHMEIHSALAWQTKSRSAFQEGTNCDLRADATAIGCVTETNAKAVVMPVVSQSRLFFGWQSSLFALATGFLLTVLVYEKWVRPSGAEGRVSNIAHPAQRHDQNRSTLATAAYLMSANGCNWRGSPMTYTVGSSVQTGDEISLLEGVAEFRLASGVGMSVEGPAAMLLASPSTVVLQRGKLVTQVPWGVSDFKAIIGGYRLVAREAEFGIAFTSSKLAIHVFSGEVMCDPPQTLIASSVPAGIDDDGIVSEEKSSAVPIRIRENYAIELTPDADGFVQQRSVPVDLRLFAAKLPMSGELPITEAYVNSVKRSKPVSYWRFESATHGQITNEVKDAPAIQITTAVALAGNEANHVIDLGPNSYQARNLTTKSAINLMETGSYSIEAWIKPSHYHRGLLVCMSAGGVGGFVLETLPSRQARGAGNPGTLHFFHRGTVAGSRSSTGNSCFSSNLYNLRQWQHVVAIKQDDHLRIYLDGKESGVTKNSEAAVARDLKLVIGRRYHGERYDEGNRFFVGQLDELAIYNRALSKQEVAEHFKAVDFQMPAIKSVSSPDI